MRNLWCGCCIFLMLFAFQSSSQEVWPGDVNNNGIVNNIDLLYLSTAFGEAGPARAPGDQNTIWEAKAAPGEWSGEFPNMLNHFYGDCDGDGFIDFLDFLAIDENYGLTHGVVMEEDFEIGTQGVSPPLFMAPVIAPIQENAPLILLIGLGSPDAPVENFHGIAFTFNYDPEIFQDEFFMVESEDFWISSDGDDNTVVVFKNFPDQGKMEVAITRTSDGVVTGSGPIASLFIVIEDNVVGFGTDIMTTLTIDKVKLIDNEANEPTPVFADSLVLQIFDEDVINDVSDILEEDIEVFPNPVKDHVNIQTGEATIERVEIFDLHGRNVLERIETIGTSFLQLNTSSLSEGMFIIKIQTDKGQLSKKLNIIR